MTEINDRPNICPDKKCQVLASTFDSHNFRLGYSFHCVGELPEPLTVRWRDSVHCNGHSLCIYTPLKGIIRFLMAIEDFESIGSDLKKAVEMTAGCSNQGGGSGEDI